MTEKSTRRETASQALLAGKLDVEGMDDVLGLYRDLFELNEKSSVGGENRRALTEEEAQMRLSEGFTLIDPEEMVPDEDELAVMVGQVIHVLGRHSEDSAALLNDMAGLQDDTARLRGLARIYLTEGEEPLRKNLVSIEGVNPEVVMFVLFNALKRPFLEAAVRCGDVDTSSWEKGHCPVCGGEPAVAYMMGEGGKRHLICHRCEAHWRYRRLACPYCGHENPRESGYLYSEDPDYRNLSASVCSQCQSYIKGWRIEGDDLGSAHPEVEDLKTPGFDRAIEEEGYSRGAPNICGVWIGTITEEEAEDA